MKFRVRTIIYSFFLLLPTALEAQGPPPGVGQGGSGQPTSDLGVVVDTSLYYYLYSKDPGRFYPIEDTLLGEYFSQYDPIRQTHPDRIHLGNLGTPHRNLIYQPENLRGITLGYTQFDLYRMTPHQMRFYRVQQAYSRMRFSQGSTQEETYFQAEFGRNFDRGLSVSLNYRRINNLGAFDYQRAEDNALGLGFWYRSPNGRYESFLTYTANSETLEENGGITAETRAADGSLVDPITVPVALNDPGSRYDLSVYAYEHYFYFLPPRDTTGQLRKATFGLTHRLQFRQEGVKYFDDGIEGEVEYYGPFVTDTRGLRHFTRLNTLGNSVDLFLATQRPSNDPKIPPRRRSFLRAGIIYDQHWLRQEPLEETRSNLFLRGEWEFTPGPAFQARAYAHLGFLSNIGDWRISGDVATSLADWFTLEGKAVFQQRSPTLLEERLFISQRPVWETEFRKHTETRIEGALFIPKTQTRVGLAWNLHDGYVYYDTLGMIQQLSTVLSVPQLRVEQSVRVWKLYLDNRVYLQAGTQDSELRMPAFYSSHSFYFKGFLFRNDAMFARFGLDLRLIGPHQPVTYFPLTGQFILQDEQELDWQPLLDAFITFKVQKFRFFFRFENMLPLLTQNYTYYVANYPVPNAGLRFGLSWQFVE